MSQFANFDGSGLGWLGTTLTAVFLVCFLGWTWWAFSPRNRERHEAASRIPFDDGGAP